MVNFYKIYNKRFLQERSHLTLEFPHENNRKFTVYIPMLENCEISESKNSNLATYNLLGRSNSLYAYMGAESRSFNLTFKISLLHLIEIDEKEGLSDNFKKQFYLFSNDKEKLKQAFFSLVNDSARTGNAFSLLGAVDSAVKFSNAAVGSGLEHSRAHRAYYQNLLGIITGQPTLFDNAINSFLDLIGEPTEEESQRFKNLNSLIDLVIYWINLIRATTYNNSSNTVYGPPIVRITHGPMYNNIPCVVNDYSIRILNDSGYDVNTLLPKQVEISLKLNEFRAGDFNEFEESKPIKGDNHVGWEAILLNNNMDPYNGKIRPIEENTTLPK